jgi:hypothetical protein
MEVIMERDPRPADFVGKTIIDADLSAANIWRFRFSDGTAIAIEAEYFGVLAILQVCEECAEPFHKGGSDA